MLPKPLNSWTLPIAGRRPMDRRQITCTECNNIGRLPSNRSHAESAEDLRMQLGIAGRRALVAGSSSGIGASIAVALAAEGARVVIHGRDRERAESVAATIRKAGGEAALVCGDLGDPAAVDAVGHGALAAFGGIDILVNSAGASDHFDPWLDTTVTTWQKQYQLSTLFAVRLIQIVVQKTGGA